MINRISFAIEAFEDWTCYRHQLCNGGQLTVVERLTGFGYWDIETGYRSPCGAFWLASGQQDIRLNLRHMSSEDEMAQWVIDRANNCVGGRSDRVGASLQGLLRWDAWVPVRRTEL